MILELTAALSILFAALSVLLSFLALRRAKRQIREFTGILTEIRDGNGNRRLLAVPGELTAPLAYEMNEIICTYEEQLSACRKTEEANHQLMTSLSHDVRTPLTTLIGYLDAVHKGIVSGAEREDYIETARRKAHDLKAYIDVLFDWFRLHSDEFTMQMALVEGAELTRNILIDWIPVLEDKQIEYVIDIPEQPFPVQLDENGYLRILNNLIQNTVIHSQADQIVIHLTNQDRNLRLDLSDNGIGIEKEDLKHIFERLYKCDKGRSADQKGSGLGLSIARQLTEKMNGQIFVSSTPGKGTVFTLLFPLAG